MGRKSISLTCILAMLAMPVVPASASAVSITGGFCDVPASSPYVSAILWAVKENIISGKSAGIFAPNEECTNEQILTFLWQDSRASGGVLGTQFHRCARRGSLRRNGSLGSGAGRHLWDREWGLLSRENTHSRAECSIPLPRIRISAEKAEAPGL